MQHNDNYQSSLMAENPLLIPLGPYIEHAQWPAVLYNNPLDGIDTRNLREEEREYYLSCAEQLFEPTRSAIDIAVSVQRMIRATYIKRNPLLAEARQRLYTISGYKDQELAKIPWLDASGHGMLIKGITGTGKSHIIERILRPIPQKYEHEKNEAARWAKHVQVPWIIAPMSHDGSRGGFLFGILAAIDKAAGTDYCGMFGKPRSNTVERLAVRVGILLIQHSVGLLVIEEMQPRSFAVSPHRDELTLFFLRLMNFGIAVILVGNPLAFVMLENYSQDLRRITTEEPIELLPGDSMDDPDYGDGLLRALWDYQVMPEKTPYTREIGSLLLKFSGGISSYVRGIVVGCQKYALRRNYKQLLPEHIERFCEQSNAMKEVADLTEGFANKDALRLSRFLDVPWEEYGIRWGCLTAEQMSLPSDAQCTGNNKSDSDRERNALRNLHGQLIKQYRAQETRRGKRKAREAALKSKMTDDDIRGEGVRRTLLDGLDTLRGK